MLKYDLANKIWKWWRDIRKWDTELIKVVDNIQNNLTKIDWYRIEDKTFTFRVWT